MFLLLLLLPGPAALQERRPVPASPPSHHPLPACAALAAASAAALVLPAAFSYGEFLEPSSIREGQLMTELAERVLASKAEFAAFPQAVLRLVAETAPTTSYRPGECVIKQGDFSK